MTTNVQTQYQRMTQTPVSKLILVLGIPTIISMLITNIYNMADTYFVSQLGTSASGATGVIFGLMAILQAFGFMFGHGAGSNISRKLGSHNTEAAKTFASTSFFLAILVGVLICGLGLLFLDPLCRLFGSTETILPYARVYAIYILLAGPAMTTGCVLNNILRYEGKAVFAMIGLTAGGILNIFGDMLFIFVFNMGIGGAGLSTLLSQYISVVILLIPYLRGQTTSTLSLHYVTKDMRVVQNICATGFPSLTRQGLNSISSMVINGTAGLYGDAAVAALSIVSRVCNFLFCVSTGIGQGFQPVSSFNFGAKLYSRVKKGFWFATGLGTLVLTLFGILAYGQAETIVTFFRNDPAVIAIGSVALRAQCLSLIVIPLSIVGGMLFQSTGTNKTATLLACLRSGFSLIPCVILLNALFGLTGLEWAQPCADVISAIISLPFIFSFFRQLPQDQPEDQTLSS